jgi:hypothetical protein
MESINSDKSIGIHLLKHYPAWKSNYKVTSDEVLEMAKNKMNSMGFNNIFIGDIK